MIDPYVEANLNITYLVKYLMNQIKKELLLSPASAYLPSNNYTDYIDTYLKAKEIRKLGLIAVANELQR